MGVGPPGELAEVAADPGQLAGPGLVEGEGAAWATPSGAGGRAGGLRGNPLTSPNVQHWVDCLLFSLGPVSHRFTAGASPDGAGYDSADCRLFN